MKYKKIIVLAIFLVLLFAISAVSAADNATRDVVSIEEISVDVVCADELKDNEFMSIKTNNQVMESKDNETDYLSINYDGTFTNLADEIDNSNGELTLTKNYVYSFDDSNYKNGININKKITINGNGFTINGKNEARAFYICPNVEVIFENLIFVNCSAQMAGTLSWDGNNGIVNNCTFINSTAISKKSGYSYSHASGGAIIWGGSANNGTVKNCKFINSKCISTVYCTDYEDGYVYSGYYSHATAEAEGGTIYWLGKDGTLCNCSFVDSSTYSKSSAICSATDLETYSLGGSINWCGQNGKITNCNFKNSKSVSVVNTYFTYSSGIRGKISDNCKGGTIYFGSLYGGALNGTITNCTFTNCSSSSNGTIYCSLINGTIVNSSFFNCSSENGGAIYWNGENGCVDNCSFLNCYSTYYGDSIYWEGNTGVVSNSSFISNQNYAQEIYVYWTGLYGSLENSKADSLSKLYNAKYKIRLKNNKEGVVINIESPNDGVVIITVLDFNNKPLSNTNLNYMVNGNHRSNFTNNNGQITLNGLFGKTTIDVKYNGDETYTDCNKSRTFNFTDFPSNKDSPNNENYTNDNITKIPTFIVMSPSLTMNYNDKKEINLFLGDIYSNPVVGAEISVCIDGKTNYLTTNEYGQINLLISNLAPDTYTGLMTFEGDNNYLNSSKNLQIKVTKATPKLTAKAKTFKKSDKTKKYTVTLKTNKNKVMKKTKLTLKVNGKTYSAKTNAKGQATFKLTKLTKKGKFTAVVKYAGSKYYNAKTVKPKITVK